MTPLIRPARESDQGFVTSTWGYSLCDGQEACDGGHRDSANWRRKRICATSRKLVDRTSEHPSVHVLIASDPTDSDKIIGWMAYSPKSAAPLMHMIYVRPEHRDSGIARAMMKQAWPSTTGPIVYTMRGPCAKSLLNRPAHQNAVHLPIDEFLA